MTHELLKQSRTSKFRASDSDLNEDKERNESEVPYPSLNAKYQACSPNSSPTTANGNRVA